MLCGSEVLCSVVFCSGDLLANLNVRHTNQNGRHVVSLHHHRAFKINELKTEVTNRLAMLEKRVERKSTA